MDGLNGDALPAFVPVSVDGGGPRGGAGARAAGGGMIVAGQRLPILIATKPVDFRCGHRALALIVQTELKLDPHSGVTVVFRSKRGDRLKILVWDGTGMVLIYKVLEQGSFAWPKVQDGVMRLSRAQAEALFEGLDWRRVVAQRVLPPLRQDDSPGRFWRCFIGLSVPDRVGRRMSQPLDLSQFPDLPPEVVKAFAAALEAASSSFRSSARRASTNRRWWPRRRPSSPS
jgi:transposase